MSPALTRTRPVKQCHCIKPTAQQWSFQDYVLDTTWRKFTTCLISSLFQYMLRVLLSNSCLIMEFH